MKLNPPNYVVSGVLAELVEMIVVKAMIPPKKRNIVLPTQTGENSSSSSSPKLSTAPQSRTEEPQKPGATEPSAAPAVDEKPKSMRWPNFADRFGTETDNNVKE